MRYGFENMNLNRIWIEAFNDKFYCIDNWTLDSYYEKLGFKNEGQKRDVAFKNGRYVSSNIYACLKEEWEPKC